MLTFISLFIGLCEAAITRYQLKEFYAGYMAIDYQIESGYATGLMKGNNGMFYKLLYQTGNNEQTITDQNIFLIWLEGGPGCTSQSAFFELIGPFTIAKSETDYTFTKKENSWNDFATILFIDQPFGTGFSYGDQLLSSTKDASKYFVEFITEFLKVHPELSKAKTYLTGFSYAGHFVPYFSEALLENQVAINYKGIIVGNGLSSLLQQISSTSNSLFINGLLDKIQRQDYLKEETKVQQQILQKMDQLTGITVSNYYEYIERSLHIDISNINRQQFKSNRTLDWLSFLKTYKDKFGITNAAVDVCNEVVSEKMSSDFSFDLSTTVISLLSKGTVFYYNGQMDIGVNNAGIFNWISTLRSEDIVEWKKQQKQIFKVNGITAGNYKKSDKLTLAIVYNAGHVAIIDQPLHVSEMIKHHLNGDDIWK